MLDPSGRRAAVEDVGNSGKERVVEPEVSRSRTHPTLTINELDVTKFVGGAVI